MSVTNNYAPRLVHGGIGANNNVPRLKPLQRQGGWFDVGLFGSINEAMGGVTQKILKGNVSTIFKDLAQVT